MNGSAKFSKLTSPGSIAGLELNNRFILAAMGSNFAEANGHCGEQIQAYYEERARGGVGLLIVETSAVSWPSGASMPNIIGYSSDEFLPGLTSLAERVHKHGSKIAAQLNHSGKVAQEDVVAGRPLLVPSVPEKGMSDLFDILTGEEIATFIKAAGPDGKGARYQVMSQEDIDWLVQQFADAARRAKQAGFDAVEIHGGHGYVISSFLSAAVNKREDQYGGTLENRARLMTEVIQGVRKEVGEAFPILIRLDAKEYRIEGGITPDDFVATAVLAEKAGADAIDVSAYGNTAKGIAFTEAPLVHQPGGFLEFARMAKRAVNIPIIAVGRVELDVAEKGLQAGDFDFVAMGRKLLADPGLPGKVARGEIDDIRPCIYCYVCVSKIFINQPMYCAVNPELGSEYLRNSSSDIIQSSSDGKKIVVIGSGPGGMEAARLLSMKGHQVSLWEKEPDLGGTARIAALAYEPNGRLIRYLVKSIQSLNVDIRRNTVASVASVQAENPDHVIVATGAARRAPEIVGKDLNHVFDGEQMRGLLFGSDPVAVKKLALYQRCMLAMAQVTQILRSVTLMRLLSHIWMPISKRVVIIGGGLVGLEMAEFLIERRRKVVVLEPSATLAPELSIVRRSRVIHMLREHGAELITDAEIDEITAEHVAYQHEGETCYATGGQVIIAIGAQPDTRLAEQLEQSGLNVTAIGDCSEVGYIEGAMAGARAAAATI